MDVSESQSRNLYAMFTVLFAINVAYTIWNIHDSRKLRIIQQQIAEEQLKQIKNAKNKEEIDN